MTIHRPRYVTAPISNRQHHLLQLSSSCTQTLQAGPPLNNQPSYDVCALRRLTTSLGEELHADERSLMPFCLTRVQELYGVVKNGFVEYTHPNTRSASYYNSSTPSRCKCDTTPYIVQNPPDVSPQNSHAMPHITHANWKTQNTPPGQN